MTHKSDTQPHCLDCGRPIRKRTEIKTWWVHQHETAPKSVAEAQACSNLALVSHRWSPLPNRPGERFISSAYYWDGESYESEFFCTGGCARRFGIAAARAGYRRQAANAT